MTHAAMHADANDNAREYVFQSPRRAPARNVPRADEVCRDSVLPASAGCAKRAPASRQHSVRLDDVPRLKERRVPLEPPNMSRSVGRHSVRQSTRRVTRWVGPRPDSFGKTAPIRRACVAGLTTLARLAR